MKIFLSITAILFLLCGCSGNNPTNKPTDVDQQNSIRQNNSQPLSNNTKQSKEEKYCLENNGTLGTINECGNEVKTCILEDGTDCPLVDFFKGYCEKGVIVEWGEECRGE